MLLLIEIDDIAYKLERKRYYLADQLRRAALSIVLNIVEGAADHHAHEKARFFGMARRSAEEVSTCLEVCFRLGILSDAAVEPLDNEADQLMAILTAIIVHHRSS